MPTTAWAKVLAATLVACLAPGARTFCAAEPATLSGVVVDASARTPIEGARLWAGDRGTGRLYPAATDPVDGGFELDLPAATYELAVELDGGLYLAHTPVQLAPGQARAVQVAIDPTLAVRRAAEEEMPPAEGTQPASSELEKPTLWNNPLTAALVVLGAAVVVGLLIEELTDEEDEPLASPFDPS